MDQRRDLISRYDAERGEINGWNSREGQLLRFKVLAEIGIMPSDSVLDVGCGTGDFAGSIECQYMGIDLSPAVIEKVRGLGIGRHISKASIDDICGSFDWVIASGIFAFEVPKWLSYVRGEVGKMFERANKGVAVNFLSAMTPNRMLADRHYANLTEIEAIAEGVSKRFTVRHDYKPNDITLYLYR